MGFLKVLASSIDIVSVAIDIDIIIIIMDAILIKHND